MKKNDTDIVKWFERLSDEINQIYDSTNTIQDDFRRECVFIARAQSHIANKWTVGDISLYRKLPELEVYYDNDAIFRLVHVLTDELSERAYLAIGIYAASGMFGNGIDAKRPDERTGLPYTIDATPFAERTLNDLESNLPNDFSKRLFDTMKNGFGNLQAKVNETQAAANLAAKNSAAAKRAAEQIAQTTAGLPAAIAETKAEATGAKVAAKSAQAAAEKAANNSETTGRLVLNHMTPRPGDYEVKQKGLSEILEALKAKVTVKTIQRWEKYLATNGKKGTKPPEGYTLQTRQTLAGATTWAETYAAREKSKLNTKVSLDRLTGGRR